MKKVGFIILIFGLILTSCKKETIEPIQPVTPNPIVTDTTDTVGDTTTIVDTTSWNNLKFDFAITTNIERSLLDSVVIIHYVNEVPTDSVTLLRTDIDGMDMNSGYIIYNSTMVHKPNSIELNGSGDSFYIFHYLNEEIVYTMSQNRFEFGTTNMQTASNFLQYTTTNGKYILSGYQVY